MNIREESIRRKGKAIQNAVSGNVIPLTFNFPKGTPFSFATDENKIYIRKEEIERIAKENPYLAYCRVCFGLAHESGHHILTNMKYNPIDKMEQLAINLVDDYQINNYITSRFRGFAMFRRYMLKKMYSEGEKFEEYSKDFKGDRELKMRVISDILNYGKINCENVENVKDRLGKKVYKNIVKCMDRVKDSKYAFKDKRDIYKDVEEYLKKVFADDKKQGQGKNGQGKQGGQDGKGGKGNGKGGISEQLSKLDIDDLYEKLIDVILIRNAKGDTQGDIAKDMDNATRKEVEDMFNITIEIEDEKDKGERRDRSIIERYVNSKIIIPKPDNYSKYAEIKRRVNSQINKLARKMNLIKTKLDDSYYYADEGLRLSNDFVLRHIAGENTIFHKRVVEQIDTKFAFMLDTSGSVDLEKNRQLFVALAEMCNKIGLSDNDFGLYAFSDNLYVIKDFAEKFDRRVKGRIVSKDIDTSWTNLCCSTDIVLQRLAKTSGENKILVIVSDGDNNSHDNDMAGFVGKPAEHLKEVVRKSGRYGVMILHVIEGEPYYNYKDSEGNLAYRDRVPNIQVKDIRELPDLFARLFFKVCWR